MNDNNIFNYSDQPTTSTSQSYPPIASQSIGPQQPIGNTSLPPDSLNMTIINPSRSEIVSFDIPGFKIIIVPTSTSSQQDNTYLNYSSSGITDNQFTQFTQFQQ